ncbi:MAG: aldo/keto reductase [Chloroflexi bacterium]|nr:aldo/keto reductase [Chloroflexota bacterium]
MHYRTLGRTGLRVSVAGLGTGGASQIGQATGRTAADSQRVVRTALDLGINVFDTSPNYRESEALLGKALEGVPRDRYILATKFPPKPRGSDALYDDPDALMRVLDESLRHLRTETIDVLQYHGVAASDYPEVVKRFQPVALRAQEMGKIRFVGITETAAGDLRHEMLTMALEDDLWDAIMVKYGILNQTAEATVLPMARARDVGVFVMASVRTSLRGPQEAVERITRFIEEGLLDIPRPTTADPLGLGALGEPRTDVTRVAYQFAAAHEAVSTVLVGTGNVEHLRANVADILAPGLPQSQLAFPRQTYGRLAWNA